MPQCQTRSIGGLKCPSAQPTMASATVLGVVDPYALEVKVTYVNEEVQVTDELLGMCGNQQPTRVMRFAARCEESGCRHFDGRDCQLAKRIVQILPAVVSDLPECAIRHDCRWYFQEGAAACKRCPQIVTSEDTADPVLVEVACGQPESRCK